MQFFSDELTSVPSGQEWMADSKEPLHSQGHGAVDAAHEAHLSHRDDVRQRVDLGHLEMDTFQDCQIFAPSRQN
jgi:hypothetical protein